MKSWMHLASALAFESLAACTGSSSGTPSTGSTSTSGVDDCAELQAADYGESLGLDARLTAYMEASARVESFGRVMIISAVSACKDLAVAAGGDPNKWAGMTGSDLAHAACDDATARLLVVLGAAASANVSVVVTTIGGYCDASLAATSVYNAKCDLTGKCTPAELWSPCEAGKLAGACSGECSGACEATGGSVDCQGVCSGNCTGTCGGTCQATGMSGACNAHCAGTCTGMCDAICEVVSPAALCPGICHGACSVPFVSPNCEGKIGLPMCAIDAGCGEASAASIEAQASCNLPEVDLQVVGDVTAVMKLQATLDALKVDLPNLLANAGAWGQMAADASAALADASAKLQGSFTQGKALACLTASFKATASAVAYVNAAVSASESVLGVVGPK